MNRLSFIIALTATAALLIASNMCFGVWTESFDRYKFVEEWYKTILYVVWSVFLVNYCIRKVTLHKTERFRSEQLSLISSILRSIQRKDVNGFIETIENFYIRHTSMPIDALENQYPQIVYCRNIIQDAEFIIQNKENFDFQSITHKGTVQQIEQNCIAYQQVLIRLIKERRRCNRFKTETK